MKIFTSKEHFKNALYLESGRILEPFDIVYETYGQLNSDKSNIILICHALTGSHHVAGYYENDRKPGWWNDFVGDGKVVDTTKYFVICSNVIGSCYGSTGPTSSQVKEHTPYRYRFPVVTIKDMVKAQRMLLDRLGIFRVRAILGGSMGGMQALQFAIDFPNFAEIIIPMAATWATQPWAISFNKVAMEAIKNDPVFDNGNYDFESVKENGMNGLAIARMAGYISFLSPETMESKFGRDYVSQDGLFDLNGRFQIENYLNYNGQNFTKWFDPLSLLYLCKAINIHDISRGYDSLEDALDRVKSKLFLIGYKNDYLFRPNELEHVKIVMDKIGKESLCEYKYIDSDYGHDAFLVELDLFEDYVRDILEGKI